MAVIGHMPHDIYEQNRGAKVPGPEPGDLDCSDLLPVTTFMILGKTEQSSLISSIAAARFFDECRAENEGTINAVLGDKKAIHRALKEHVRVLGAAPPYVKLNANYEQQLSWAQEALDLYEKFHPNLLEKPRSET